MVIFYGEPRITHITKGAVVVSTESNYNSVITRFKNECHFLRAFQFKINSFETGLVKLTFFFILVQDERLCLIKEKLHRDRMYSASNNYLAQ